MLTCARWRQWIFGIMKQSSNSVALLNYSSVLLKYYKRFEVLRVSRPCLEWLCSHRLGRYLLIDRLRKKWSNYTARNAKDRNAKDRNAKRQVVDFTGLWPTCSKQLAANLWITFSDYQLASVLTSLCSTGRRKPCESILISACWSSLLKCLCHVLGICIFQ